MEIPPDFSEEHSTRAHSQKVCHLLKSLYGLKQASRQCDLKLTGVLLRHTYC